MIKRGRKGAIANKNEKNNQSLCTMKLISHIIEWSHKKIASNALDYISMTFLIIINLTKTKLEIKLVENVGGQVLVTPKEKLEILIPMDVNK